MTKQKFKKIVFILEHGKITTLLPKGALKKIFFILEHEKITTLLRCYPMEKSRR